MVSGLAHATPHAVNPAAQPTPPPATLDGVVERIIFLTRRTITRLRRCGRSCRGGRGKAAALVTVVGVLPGVECGETLHLSGEWTRHAQHGAQFKIAALSGSELPSSVYGISEYLGSGLVPGIGNVMRAQMSNT